MGVALPGISVNKEGVTLEIINVAIFVKILYDFSAALTSVSQDVALKLDSNGLTKVTTSRLCARYIYRTRLTLASRIAAATAG